MFNHNERGTAEYLAGKPIGAKDAANRKSGPDFAEDVGAAQGERRAEAYDCVDRSLASVGAERVVGRSVRFTGADRPAIVPQSLNCGERCGSQSHLSGVDRTGSEVGRVRARGAI